MKPFQSDSFSFSFFLLFFAFSPVFSPAFSDFFSCVVNISIEAEIFITKNWMKTLNHINDSNFQKRFDLINMHMFMFNVRNYWRTHISYTLLVSHHLAQNFHLYREIFNHFEQPIMCSCAHRYIHIKRTNPNSRQNALTEISVCSANKATNAHTHTLEQSEKRKLSKTTIKTSVNNSIRISRF